MLRCNEALRLLWESLEKSARLVVGIEIRYSYVVFVSFECRCDLKNERGDETREENDPDGR